MTTSAPEPKRPDHPEPDIFEQFDKGSAEDTAELRDYLHEHGSLLPVREG